MQLFGVLMVAIWVFVASCWCINVVKLTECDFEAPYRCEVVHLIGLVGPASIVTVWMETDDE
jgi:hypothetical protein